MDAQMRLSDKAKDAADRDAEMSLARKVSDLERRLAAEKSRRALAEKIIEDQQERIEKTESGIFKFPKQKPGKNPKTFLRVCIPDTHGSYIDPEAASAFFSDLEALKPSEIIMLGDHVDCGGFLAQHHTNEYVAQCAYSFADDLAAGNQFIDEIQKLCPTAKIDYLEGNHEFRISRWCVTQALAHAQDAEFLLKMLSVKNQLRLKDRGIPYYRQGEFYDGCSIPATIKRGKCYFTHGSRVGVNSARMMLTDFGGNVVYGHVHRMLSFVGQSVHGGQIGAWSPGFLAKLQPYWKHTQISGWAHGYGLQIVEEASGAFLHLNVPIINGRSLLFSLTKRLQ
jgi:hypothetical protein